MGLHQAKLGRVRGFQGGSFGAEASLGSFFDIPAIVDSIKPAPDEVMEQPGHVFQRLDHRAKGVPKPRLDTRFGFATNLETFTTKATDGVAATKHWKGKLLESAFGTGSSRLTTGTTIASASTATVLNVTSATTHRAGCWVALVNAAGLLECRRIKSISGSALTLAMALSFTPSNGATVYGGATYFLHNHPNGVAPPYMQYIYEGYSPYDKVFFPTGVVESMSFDDMSPGALPRLQWNWQHPSWMDPDGTQTTMNLLGTDLDTATYVDTVLNTIRNADMRVRKIADGSALADFVDAAKVQITPNVKYEAYRSPGGPFASTVRDYRRVEVFPDYAFTAQFEIPQEDSRIWDEYQADGEALNWTYQIGNDPTRGCVCFDFPNVQILRKPAILRDKLLEERQIMIGARQDEETVAAGGATTDDKSLATCAARIIFF